MSKKSRLKFLLTTLLRKNNPDKRNGFTLIEILIVMVILGLLASLVGPRMFGKLGMAKQKTAKTQIEMLLAACDAFRLDLGVYPSSLNSLIENDISSEKWQGPYLAKNALPIDPWGNEYVYERIDGPIGIKIYSYGADSSPGGDGENADVLSWE